LPVALARDRFGAPRFFLMTTPTKPAPAFQTGSPRNPADGRLAASIDAWKRKLLDLSKRNRALNFRATKVSTVAIVDEHPAEIFRLLYLAERELRFKAAELFDAVDAVDALKIAERLEKAAAERGKRLPVLIEVKLSHEESKHGVAPEELSALLDAMSGMKAVQAVGLMTVPPWSEDAETARPYFRELRRLRDEVVKAHPGVTQLSMGMSNDFVVAIEEGSTCVRVGTAIFGKRVYPVKE